VTKTRQRAADLVGFYLRVPAELKRRIEALAQARSVSQAELCNDLIARGMELPPADARLGDWLQRVAK
jgi:hypothetical protein